MKKVFYIFFLPACLIIVFPSLTHAFSLTSLTPINYFGGKITQVTYCTCYYDPAVVLTIADLASKNSIKVKYSLFFSRLDANFNIWEPSVSVLGGTSPGDTECRNTSGYSCSDSSNAQSVVDFIRGIGSSLK